MTDLPAARSTATPHRHRWDVVTGGVDCCRCGRIRDIDLSRRGKQSRNYGNRAELEAARRYGGVKVGHHGGKVDIRGTDFATQMRTRRTKPPVEWKTAIGAMADETRCPRLLIRFVQPTGPEDYFVFRASDFLAWFGKDEETA